MVKYLGKKVVALGGALLFSTLANAAEIYNKDGTDLTLGGRVLAGGETQADTAVKYNEITSGNSLRLNLQGSTKLENDWQGFFRTEYQFNFDADQDFGLTPRLSYIGIKNQSWTLSAGKQFSAYYDVASYTDQLQVWGGEASTVRYNGLDLSERVSKSAILRYRAGNLALAVMGAQGYDGEYDETRIESGLYSVNQASKKYEHGGSAEYTITEGFKLGAGYSVVITDLTSGTRDVFNNTDTITTDKNTTQKYVYGGTFNSGAVTIAAIGLVMKDSLTSNGYYNGAEAFASYKLTELGSNIYTGYNYLNVDEEGYDYKVYNYVAVGYAHHFAKNLYAFAEYRYDARTKEQKANINQEDVSGVGAYIRYNF